MTVGIEKEYQFPIESREIVKRRYMIREEPFGYTLYDRNLLNSKFVRKNEFSVTNEESANFSKKIEEIKNNYPGLNILHFMRSTKSRSINGKSDRFGLQAGPPSGFTTFNIACDGGIYGGGYVPYIDNSWCLGNIKKDDIFDIWQKRDLLEKQRKQSQELRDFCGKCPVFGSSCAETKWEIELNRQLHPESNNYYCIYGRGEPLLDILKYNKTNEKQ